MKHHHSTPRGESNLACCLDTPPHVGSVKCTGDPIISAEITSNFGSVKGAIIRDFRMFVNNRREVTSGW